MRFLTILACISSVTWKNHFESPKGNLVPRSILLSLSVKALRKGDLLVLVTSTEISFSLVSHKARSSMNYLFFVGLSDLFFDSVNNLKVQRQ